MSRQIAFIHTSPSMIPVFKSLSDELLKGLKPFNMVDESLLCDIIAQGTCPPATAKRLVNHVLGADEAGADFILVTCSSTGRADEASRALVKATVLRVDEPGKAPGWFTLLKNAGHSNVSHVFAEGRELLPRENTLTVVPGFVGAYPNALYAVGRSDLPALRAAIGALASEADYRALADRYALRRTRADFWARSDALQDAYAAWAPVEAGLLDYNRLENR